MKITAVVSEVLDALHILSHLCLTMTFEILLLWPPFYGWGNWGSSKQESYQRTELEAMEPRLKLCSLHCSRLSPSLSWLRRKPFSFFLPSFFPSIFFLPLFIPQVFLKRVDNHSLLSPLYCGKVRWSRAVKAGWGQTMYGLDCHCTHLAIFPLTAVVTPTTPSVPS